MGLEAGSDARATGPECNRLAARLRSILSGLRTLRDRLAGQRRALGSGDAPHPFEVRQRPASDTTWDAADWRHFSAAGGTINGHPVPAASFAAPADAETVYVWLEIEGSLAGPVFAMSAVTWHHDTAGWGSFPALSGSLTTAYVLVAVITLDLEDQSAAIHANVRTSLTVAPVTQAAGGERVLRVWGPDNHPAAGVTDPVTADLDGECCGCGEWGGCTTQQVAGWSMLTGYAPHNLTAEDEPTLATCYETAELAGEPTKAGLEHSQSAYSATITQPRPDDFVGLYPRDSTLWDAYPVVWHMYSDRNVPGFSHSPDGDFFYLTNLPGWPNFLGEIHFSNGVGADNGGAAAWREAMYWLDEPGSPTATSLVVDGRSMVTPFLGALPTTVHEQADAASAELSAPITISDVRTELAARIAAATFPLAGGPGRNLVFDRDESGTLVNNRTNPLDWNVTRTCHWCVGEDIHPDSPYFYYGHSTNSGLCPQAHPLSESFAAPRARCRKAPPGPWYDRSCADPSTEDETNLRYFAINYRGWVLLDRHQYVEEEHPEMGQVARREYDEEYAKRRAFWAAKIWVMGMAPGQPYILRFYPQGGGAYEDEELEVGDCPAEDPECTEVPFQIGFNPATEADRWGYKKVICLPAP